MREPNRLGRWGLWEGNWWQLHWEGVLCLVGSQVGRPGGGGVGVMVGGAHPSVVGVVGGGVGGREHTLEQLRGHSLMEHQVI